MAEDRPELKQITCIHDLHNLEKKILFWRLSLASVHVGLITLHPTISEMLRSCPTYSADASRRCLPLCIWFQDMHVSEIGIFSSSSTESPRLVQPQTKIHTDLHLSGSFKPRNSRLFQQLQNSFIQITYPLKKMFITIFLTLLELFNFHAVLLELQLCLFTAE